MEQFNFNTYIANLMEFNNVLSKVKSTSLYRSPPWEEAVRTMLLLLAPVCPHIAEEMWERIGEPYSIHQQRWPEWDPEIAREEVITLVVQVNGKVREPVGAKHLADEGVLGTLTCFAKCFAPFGGPGIAQGGRSIGERRLGAAESLDAPMLRPYRWWMPPAKHSFSG